MDNLPLIGWLNLRGRCNYCRTEIPFRYLWVEILTGTLHFPLMFLAMEHSSPLTFFLVSSAILSWALLLSLIDGEHYYIPDLLTLGPLFFLVILQSQWEGEVFKNPLLDFFILSLLFLLPQAILDFFRSLLRTLFGEKTDHSFGKCLGLLISEDGSLRPSYIVPLAMPLLFIPFLFYPSLNSPEHMHHWMGLGVALLLLLSVEKLTKVLLKAPGLGLGDVKLGALLGWALGWPAFLLCLGLACSTALSIAILKGIHRKKNISLPFGPFLVWAGIFIYLMEIYFFNRLGP
jgi:prepilin signal peptidase PulO-like enzyme (type II secretory pathway)